MARAGNFLTHAPVHATSKPSLVAQPVYNARLSLLQVISIEPALPSLEELHLCGNGMRAVGDLDRPTQGFASLQVRPTMSCCAFTALTKDTFKCLSSDN